VVGQLGARLTLVATSPWFLELAGVRVPDGVRAVVALAPVAVLNLGAERLGLESEPGHTELTLMIVVFLAGETVAVSPPRLAFVVATASAALTLAAETDTHPGDIPIWTVAVAIAVACGFFIRALIHAIVELEATQAELAAKAATDERNRIAREVHDVIAHSLAVAMLHITAARLAVRRGDSAAANEALEEAEQAGRHSLVEVRRTIGLLREEATLEPPAPEASEVRDLVDGFRSAGLAVELVVDGDLAALSPQVGLALYRIVQESLANVVRHTPGASAKVHVDASDLVHVTVSSSGGRPVHAPGTGSGLLGMSERAEALGGSCWAGPAGDGWLVDAVLVDSPTGVAP
jgi:signal transduction histidine kinase